jgi:NifU-like protein involved in Fe-S cluster formation
MDIDAKAQKVSDLAFEGQGCSIDQELTRMRPAEIIETLQKAQKIADERTKSSHQFPVVEFEADQGFIVAGARVSLLDPQRAEYRTLITDMAKGDFRAYHQHCENLKP